MNGVAHLSEVTLAPNAKVVDALEKLLERAKSGEVRGLVALVNCGQTITNYAAGDSGFTDILAAFEDWKFQELATRNLRTVES